jgi:DNA-directed RNA polymerase specialized sigma24 family protein
VKSHNFDEPSISAMGEAAAGADPDVVFRKDLLELIPFLRAFSRSLCGDRELADDLAQEALAKAWQSRDTFRAG